MSAPSIDSAKTRRKRPDLFVGISLGFLLILATIALGSTWIAPQDPEAQSLLHSGQGPSSTYVLGTDSLGRDILSRVLEGTGTAVLGPLIVAVGTTFLAVVLGLVAGFKGGYAEATIMRVADAVYAFPSLLVIIVAAGLFGGGYWLAVGLLIVLLSPSGIRIVRSAVLTQRNLPYIEAAQLIGVPNGRVMRVHIFPNILPTVVAAGLLDFVAALVGLSALSFLGLGSPPGSMDWGRMLTENRILLDVNPWAAVVPAAMLIATSAAVTIVGDWLFDRLKEGR